MITRIKSERIIKENGIFPGYVYWEAGRITAVTEKELPYDTEYDVGNLYVSPGFIDMHTHGGAGFDFINGERDILEGSSFHLSHGTTSICPTISAAPFDAMAKAAKAISNVMKSGKAKVNILGAHMEGPYLSKEQCGAQSTEFITPPDPADYVPLIERYGDAIARWSYAPEQDEGGVFCAFLKKHNIVASAGHTNAVYSEMQQGMEQGLSLVTHLYSCTSTITRDHGFRRLGVIETAYLCDDLYVEIIADGKHLPPDLIRLILKVKGTDRVALITDSLSITGTSAKTGKMVDTEYVIEDGVCKLLDRSAFAGSIATADRLVRVLKDEVGVPLTDAVKMITKVPAEIMHVKKGVLAENFDADILVFDDNIEIQKAWVMGTLQYKKK